ncbi:SURF1 family protein [Rhodobacteraceae bacterium 63075]|nr:SURF1 family protein [Rhodobacteraceae bacterium 63075]
MKRNLPVLIASAIVLAILISLGNWQVRRLAEKEAYLAELGAMISAEAVGLPGQARPEDHQFLAVRAEGRFTGAPLRFLVSTRDAGAGYRFVQAFETEGRRVMVDRGFIPTGRKDMTVPENAATVTGNLHWPNERDSYTPENDREENIWYAREVPVMAEALGAEPLLIIARETTPPQDGIAPLPVDTSGIPNRHLEYIITWYGLALTWMIMTAYFLRRRARTSQP